MTDGSDLPVVTWFARGTDREGGPSPDLPADGSARVAGVLLAAGTSSRFDGANKLLARVDDETIVRRAARTLATAGLSPLVAVVGHEGNRVASAVDGLGFEVVHNDAYGHGQSTSVAAGVGALGPDVDAAVFALGDMPLVHPASVVALVAAYRAGAGTALAAACEGERGNPVLFDARHFPALADVTGDTGGRAILLEGADSALVETGDPGVLRDVDTRSDLESLRA
jgi:molybdenum cofactor cytidylyltransferase